MEYFCEIILKSDHWPRRSCLKLLLLFFFIVFFLVLALAAIFSAELNNFNNFSRGSPKEHLC